MKRLICFLLACLPLVANGAYISRELISVTTSAGGAFTGYTNVVTGCVLQVTYVPGGSPIDTNGDIDFTGEVSGTVIANHDNIGTSLFTAAYRQATVGVTGAAALYAGGGTAVNDLICVANERIKLVVANGGNVTTGSFYVYVGSP